ncbi:uncharacterized protein LOC142566761 [Dermacentor variabilis]|uniref:uncharacterized protein LOC142566761 n=1 Tax=Dermacentor variabilis TaxID=34621 RepID=UPI003F5C7F23
MSNERLLPQEQVLPVTVIKQRFSMAGIKPPRPFDFQNAADWPAWMDELDDYRFASGLHEKPDEVKVRTLLYTMGRKSREILRSLNVKDEEMEDLNLVKSKFKGYFVHTKNPVYESARYNIRRQQLGETVEQFATELNRPADRCEFKEMKEGLIRDRFVVGLRDQLLSEELQMDPNLTLSTAFAKARTSETVQKQQAELKEHEGAIPEACVAAVKPEKTPGKSKKFTLGQKPGYRGKSCSFCAGPFHPRSCCPAKQERCRFCRKLGHFEKACRKTRQADGNLDDIAEPDKFLGTVEQSANTPSDHFVTGKLSEECQKLTTFITPYGRYCYRRLPFGITTAPNIFQRKLSQVVEGLDGVLNYSDDILVCGKNKVEHDNRLRNVLDRQEQTGVTLSKEKYCFAVEQVPFLGMICDANGVRPDDPEKIKAIKELPRPQNVAEVRSF